MLSNFGQSDLEPPSDRNRFSENSFVTVMNARRGVKRKRGPAKPLQATVGIPLKSSFPWFSLKSCVQSQPQSRLEQVLPGELVHRQFCTEMERT